MKKKKKKYQLCWLSFEVLILNSKPKTKISETHEAKCEEKKVELIKTQYRKAVSKYRQLIKPIMPYRKQNSIVA